MARAFGPFDNQPMYEAVNRRMQRLLARASETSGLASTSQAAVTVGTGAQLVIAAYPDGALVDGLYVENTDTEAVALTTNSGSPNPRIDRLVLRLDMAARTIAPFQIVGTPAASPVAPALSATATVVDMPLCRFTMPGNASAQNPGSVVDERVSVDGSTSSATAGRIARRDSSGRLQVATPSASADAATKGYVDGANAATQGELDTLESNLQRVAPTALSVASGFENWGFGYRDLCYWREGRTVHVTGVVRLLASMSSQSTRLIATLPSGFRPTATVIEGSVTNARIQVLNNGQVRLENDTFGVTLQPGLLVPVNAVIPLG